MTDQKMTEGLDGSTTIHLTTEGLDDRPINQSTKTEYPTIWQPKPDNPKGIHWGYNKGLLGPAM